MTREEAKKFVRIANAHLKEITAFAEGAIIQWYHPVSKEWKDAAQPAFDGSTEYRVKPEPKILWVARSKSFNCYVEVAETKQKVAEKLLARFGTLLPSEVERYYDIIELVEKV